MSILLAAKKLEDAEGYCMFALVWRAALFPLGFRGGLPTGLISVRVKRVLVAAERRVLIRRL